MSAQPALREVQIAGRLTHFAKNWAAVSQDPWIHNTIQGFQIEFTEEPRQYARPRTPKLSSEEVELISEEVGAMLSKGAIRELNPREAERGFYSSLFLVPKKDGKMRPVINLKRLNSYIPPHHFKMEGTHTLRELLREGDWLTKVDLKDAYFMIPIHVRSRKFIQFAFQNHYYQFTCLPFGLSVAPWVFTKTLRPLAAVLRELGIRLITYIDDILIMAGSPEQARDHTLALIYLLENVGFIVHPSKTVTTPTQRLEFLGMDVDTPSM